MEQEPARRGPGPLDAPDVRVAQAALDMLPGVAQRRDARLDRRRLGRILLIDAIVPTAAFVSWFLSQLLRDPSVSVRSIPTLALLIVVLMWDQLARGLRERYGAAQALRGATRTVHGVLLGAGAAAFIVALFLTNVRGAVPILVVVLGAVLWLCAGLWGWGAMRRGSRDAPAVPMQQHAEMNVAGRIATGFFGLGLGLNAVVGPWYVAGGGFEVLAVVAALISLAIAGVGRFAHAVPELGAAWRPAQWTVFGLSAVITCVAPVLAFADPARGVVIGVVAAGAILVLFLGAALWPVASDA